MEILKENKSFYEYLYKKREIIDKYSVNEKLKKKTALNLIEKSQIPFKAL